MSPSKAERDRDRRVALVSQARAGRFGTMPDDAAVWWQQMQTVAAELGITITWDEVQARRSPRLDA